MSTSDQRLARALRRLSEETGEVPDSPEARRRIVEALTAELGRPPVSSRPRRLWVGFALAASLAAVTGVQLWLRARTRPEVPPAIAEGPRAIAGDERISSDRTAIALALPGGVGLVLQPASEVEVRDRGARVILLRGRVAADVTSSDALFVLESGETRFASRRARFSASAGAGCDGRPELTVSTGTVTIDTDARVEPGETWPRCPAVPERAERVAPPRPAPTRIAPTKATAPPPPPTKEDRLARQNALYLRALELQRSGELGAAVDTLDRVLLDDTSPLAETALAQKMRWLSQLDPSRAREAAREYLRRFPMGFGRAEAETLTLEPR